MCVLADDLALRLPCLELRGCGYEKRRSIAISLSIPIAFVVVRNGDQYSTRGVAALAHADFVSHFHTRDVPLLAFDPADFDEPFSADLPKPSEMRECGVWCNKWTTQDENCNNCV